MLLGVANSDIPSASEQGCPCKSAIGWCEINDQLAIVQVDQFFVPIQRHGPVAQRQPLKTPPTSNISAEPARMMSDMAEAANAIPANILAEAAKQG